MSCFRSKPTLLKKKKKLLSRFSPCAILHIFYILIHFCSVLYSFVVFYCLLFALFSFVVFFLLCFVVFCCGFFCFVAFCLLCFVFFCCVLFCCVLSCFLLSCFVLLCFVGFFFALFCCVFLCLCFVVFVGFCFVVFSFVVFYFVVFYCVLLCFCFVLLCFVMFFALFCHVLLCLLCFVVFVVFVVFNFVVFFFFVLLCLFALFCFVCYVQLRYFPNKSMPGSQLTKSMSHLSQPPNPTADPPPLPSPLTLSPLSGSFNHWFDGMALLHQFQLAHGTVSYRSRFLQSSSYVRNRQHSRIVASEFGTLALPDPCQSLFGRFLARFEPLRKGGTSTGRAERLLLEEPGAGCRGRCEQLWQTCCEPGFFLGCDPIVKMMQIWCQP